MDKQKQIVEMAIIIEHACDDCNGTVDHCIKCPYKCTKQYGCGELKTATDLYNAGYRKIPEDSVVLSSRELADSMGETWKQARKQVVKEVLDKVYDWGQDFFVEYTLMEEDEFNGILNERAKELGVEVEEWVKK